MSNKEEKLKQLRIENNIWVVYIGIIIFSWYSNYLEKNYILTGNNKIKDEYRTIIIVIFGILVLVYFYFLKSSYKDLVSLKDSDTEKKKLLVYFSFLASLLIFIAGVIFLIIALCDDNLDVELAFN